MRITNRELDLLRRRYEVQAWSCVHNDKRDRNGDEVRMRMDFEEWLWVWIESGHLHERGLGANKYCMSRKNDIGHYELGNVRIVTNRENGQEAAKRPNFGLNGYLGAMKRIWIDGTEYESYTAAIEAGAMEQKHRYWIYKAQKEQMAQ